jgi:hypothetical protein
MNSDAIPLREIQQEVRLSIPKDVDLPDWFLPSMEADIIALYRTDPEVRASNLLHILAVYGCRPGVDPEAAE